MPSKSLRKPKAPPAERPKEPADVFADQPEPVRALANRLRALIAETLPGLTEAAYGGKKVRLTLFSRDTSVNVICGVQPGADGCLLYFHHLTPADSTVLKLEGKGKHARHTKLTALDRRTAEEVQRLLLLASTRAAAAK